MKLPLYLEEFGKSRILAYHIWSKLIASSWNGQVPTALPAAIHSSGQWAETGHWIHSHRFHHKGILWLFPRRLECALCYQTKEIMQRQPQKQNNNDLLLLVNTGQTLPTINYLPLLVLFNDQSNTSTGYTWMWLFVQNYIYAEWCKARPSSICHYFHASLLMEGIASNYLASELWDADGLLQY